MEALAQKHFRTRVRLPPPPPLHLLPAGLPRTSAPVSTRRPNSIETHLSQLASLVFVQIQIFFTWRFARAKPAHVTVSAKLCIPADSTSHKAPVIQSRPATSARPPTELVRARVAAAARTPAGASRKALVHKAWGSRNRPRADRQPTADPH